MGGPSFSGPSPIPAQQTPVPATFVDDGPAGTPDPAEGSPEAAAQQVANFNDLATDDAIGQTNLFAQQLIEHEGDVAWIQSFYSELGGDKSAELISQTASPESYTDWPIATAQEHTQAVAQSLDTLYEAGALNEADIAALVQDWATDADTQVNGRDFNTGVGQIIAQSGNEELQTAYALAAIDTAANTPGLSTDMQADLNGSAAFVLAGTSADNQVLQLDALRDSGQLEAFIQGALAADTEIPAITVQTHDEAAFTGGPAEPLSVANDGVATLALNLAHADVRDPISGPLPISNDDLSNLRQEFFVTTSTAAEAQGDTWRESTGLKDGLSVIFEKEFDNLIFDNLAENNASLKNGTVQESFEAFFEFALFTTPAGSRRDTTSAFLADTVGGWIGDIQGLSDTDFAATYGIDKTQLSKIAGEVLAHVSNGMESAIATAKDRRATHEAILKTMTDMAFALIPGGGPLKSLAGELTAAGAESVGRMIKVADGQVRGAIDGMVKSEVKEALLEELPELNPDAVLESFPQELNDIIPDSNNRNYLTAFQASYNTIDALR